jgi:predicted Zn-dependent protease
VRGELTPELDERFAWQVLLGKDRTINAFAVPGGWLGLNLGLVSVTANRDELASVLAHELSHVTQRHISRMMAQDKQADAADDRRHDPGRAGGAPQPRGRAAR